MLAGRRVLSYCGGEEAVANPIKMHDVRVARRGLHALAGELAVLRPQCTAASGGAPMESQPALRTVNYQTEEFCKTST